jgi:LPXTG-motif cell wall-anchored protein
VSAAKPSATIRYTAMRLLIFVGCFFVAGVAVHFGVLPSGVGGSNAVWVILLGLLFSAPLSFILLRKQRDEMSEQLISTVDRTRSRLEANRTREDNAAQ